MVKDTKAHEIADAWQKPDRTFEHGFKCSDDEKRSAHESITPFIVN